MVKTQGQLLTSPQLEREQRLLRAVILEASILMVDDDPVLTQIIQAHLRASGYRNFASETDPHAALTIMEDAQPDLLLLDLVMPGVDGFAVLERIRQNPRTAHLPVIMLTASADAHVKLDALERGATDFIPKPVDQSELLLRIRNILTVKAYQDRLTYYDHLTGLPNRMLFLDRLEWALKNAQRSSNAVAVMSIGLGHLRKIHDSFGASVADALLTEAAERLLDSIRESDVIAHVGGEELWRNFSRLGNDEFSVLLTATDTPDSSGYVAMRLLEAIKAPFFIQDHELFVHLEVGIAIYPEDGQQASTLLQHATSARDYVKRQGQAGFQFFSRELQHQTRALLQLEMDLHKALERSEFLLHYQPQINPISGQVVGVEALLRWQHPTQGMVSPAHFIPLAERMGLIEVIGEWALKEACQQAARWITQGVGRFNVSVNLSARQFVLDDLAELVRQTLESTGLPPELLTLELTESLLLQNTDVKIQILEQLQVLGVSLSIDDFGTGFSSLVYLRRLPVSELKIDREFIIDIDTDETAQVIVSGIVNLAKNLKMTIVAEGVEEAGQLAFVESLGCDLVQGFYYSRPLDVVALEGFVGALQKERDGLC